MGGMLAAAGTAIAEGAAAVGSGAAEAATAAIEASPVGIAHKVAQDLIGGNAKFTPDIKAVDAVNGTGNNSFKPDMNSVGEINGTNQSGGNIFTHGNMKQAGKAGMEKLVSKATSGGGNHEAEKLPISPFVKAQMNPGLGQSQEQQAPIQVQPVMPQKMVAFGDHLSEAFENII